MIRQRTLLHPYMARQPIAQSAIPTVQNVTKQTADCLGDVSLAMVYSPVQKYRELYSPEEALHKGTLFKELYLPFHGGFKI